MFYVYVIRNQDGRLYIGQTNDLERRLEQHQLGLGGWTRLRVVQTEEFETRGEAMKRERQLKSGRANQALRELAESVERLLPGKD